MSTFQELGLRPELLSALAELGFEQPMPIQEKSIPAVLGSKQDVIAFAQTGTGKTAAFSLPIIQMVDIDVNKVQALVLCPTRELCIQITSDLEKLSKNVRGFKFTAVYGGANIQTQIGQLRRGAHVVVGTPGRTLDLVKRNCLDISNINWLVLDEADEMLNMGFKEDLDSILDTTPKEKQTMLFSATMSREVMDISRKYMNNPIELSVGKRNNSAENITHEFYMVHAKDRYQCLKRIADMNPDIFGIVFCRTRMETKEIVDKLIEDGYNADALHGDLSQVQREQVMGRFRLKNLQILVATDVAARGLDVSDLSHVINYNLPDDLEVYIHRTGRTGRAGKSGVAVSIIHMKEFRKIKDLERMSGKKFEQKRIPSGRDICEKQLFALVERVKEVEVNHVEIDRYLPTIFEKFEDITREDLIKHFVSVEFNRFLAAYQNAPDLNVSYSDDRGGYGRDRRDDRGGYGRDSRGQGDRGGYGRDRRDDRRSDDRGGYSNRDDRGGRGNFRDSGRDSGGGRDYNSRDRRVNFAKFSINVGFKDKVNPMKLIELITSQPSLRRVEIGKIDITKKYSTVEIDSRFQMDVIKELNGQKVDGVKIQVELSGNEGGYGGGSSDFQASTEPRRPAKKRIS